MFHTKYSHWGYISWCNKGALKFVLWFINSWLCSSPKINIFLYLQIIWFWLYIAFLFVFILTQGHAIDFRERGREEKRGRETQMQERNIDQLPLLQTLSRDWTHNPGMCPDWEWNLWPSGLWDNIPTNWAALARADCVFFLYLSSKLLHSIVINTLK